MSQTEVWLDGRRFLLAFDAIPQTLMLRRPVRILIDPFAVCDLSQVVTIGVHDA